jgi:hypothetical protein
MRLRFELTSTRSHRLTHWTTIDRINNQFCIPARTDNENYKRWL